jgi:ADP-ribose pyrophosphatase YjhB (NUDIX family)
VTSGLRRSLEDALRSRLLRLTPRVVGIAFFEGRVLLVRHGNTGWELPGARKARGERNRAFIVRWFAEQLGVEVVVGGPMGISGVARADGWNPFVASGCRLVSVEGLRVPDGYEDARLFLMDDLDALHLEKAYADFIGMWTPEIAAGGLPMKPPEH